MSDREDLVTKVPGRLLERLVRLFLHSNPQLDYRMMLIAARGESLAVWDSTFGQHAADPSRVGSTKVSWCRRSFTKPGVV